MTHFHLTTFANLPAITFTDDACQPSRIWLDSRGRLQCTAFVETRASMPKVNAIRQYILNTGELPDQAMLDELVKNIEE